MTKPILPHHVIEGSDYWASWGSKGWTAVRVLHARRKFAEVERVNPKTNATKSRRAKVRLDELVKRDPRKKGRDKPDQGPAEIFAAVRRDREATSVPIVVEAQPDDDEKETYSLPPGRFSHSFETKEEAEAFFRKTWDSLHGEGAFDAIEDDW